MIYFLLLFLIVFIYFFTKIFIRESNKQNKVFVVLSFLAIIILFSLRSSTVGRDLPGYKTAYLFALTSDFSRFDYWEFSSFEIGYVLFMKVCSIMGLNFQLFLTVCSLLMLVPVAVFIYRFSNNSLLSIIVFICYSFFEFYMSAIRQSISISIFLIGLMVLLSRRKHSLLGYYFFCVVAFLFHYGAIVCFFLPLLKLIKKTTPFLIASVLVTIFLLILRTPVFSFINTVFRGRDVGLESNAFFGLNSAILIILVILFLILLEKMERNQSLDHQNILVVNNYQLFLKMVIVSICISVFFGTSHMARTCMYYLIPIVLLLPNLNAFLSKKSEKVIVNIALACFLFVYFGITIFVENNLDIFPYYFYQ